MNYRLGLDIGIASIGWCVMEHDLQGNPCHIVDLGIFKFKPAEKPKTGESPSVDRRNARGIRRSIRRKRQRLDKVKNLLEDKLLQGRHIDFTPCDLYDLRCRALDKELSDNELARVLYSMAKHRGFQSNRKSELEDKSNSKLVTQLKENSQEASEYRTIGEMYIKDNKFVELRTKIVDGEEVEYKVYHIRNKGEESERGVKTFLRNDILSEISLILQRQAKFNKKIDNDFIEDYKRIFSYQKSYDEGPDFPSPYRVEFNVGSCSFFKDQKRMQKASFSFEYFSALCDINHLRLLENGKERQLNDEERKLIIEYILKNKELKYGKLRKILSLSDDVIFRGKSNCNKDTNIFVKMPATYQIAHVLEIEDWKTNKDILNQAGYILSMFKSDERRRKEFKKNKFFENLSTEKIENLIKLDFSKFGHISQKALDLIIPGLEEGLDYQKAYVKAGLSLPQFEKNRKLIYANIPEIQDITSPVVKRAVSQTIKQVNAIIDKYGSPSAIFIELAREVSKDFAERHKLEKQMEENAQNNENIKKQLQEMGIPNPKGEDVLKFRLYEQQHGQCLYSGVSFDKKFGSMKAIFFDNTTQIDHIIPFSRCYDNSFSNKVLVVADENQRKGDRTPYEYFGQDQEKWNAFVARASAFYGTSRKFSNCVIENLSEEKEKELNNRAMNDTKYIARFMHNLFLNHLQFASSPLEKRPVRAVNGAMTGFMRNVWGIEKIRFADDLHHAKDAAVIACIDQKIIQRVTRYLQLHKYNKRVIDLETGEILRLEDRVKDDQKLKLPYPEFREELLLRLSADVEDRKNELLKLGYDIEELDCVKKVNVCRMVNHKVKGAIHEDTVRSKGEIKNSKLIVYSKTPITQLKLDSNGQINDYPKALRESDPKLYEVLRDRLIEFNGDGKKAFEKPIYKPSKTGLNQNQIKKVKLEKIVSDPIEINGGVTENASMIRIDVFEKKGKFYFIPVYVADYYKKKLPNRICKASGEWPELDDSYNFKFSLFQNDVVRIKFKDNLEMYPCDNNAEKKKVVRQDEFFYYTGANRAVAAIVLETINGDFHTNNIGIQKALFFEKYEIDRLGNLRKVKFQPRREFE